MMDASFTLECTSCDKVITEAPPCTTENFTEYNLVQVYLSLMTGVGRAGIQNVVGFQGDPFSCSSYAKHCTFLFKQMNQYYEDFMKKARAKVRQYYIEQLEQDPDENGYVATDVTFDGRWMARGQKPYIGVCFVIEAYTKDNP